MVDFKGVHYPKTVIVHAVFFYLRYAVSCRDLEEIMAERGVEVDHATLNRWVVKFAPLIAARAQARKRPTATSWRMDETLSNWGVGKSWWSCCELRDGKSAVKDGGSSDGDPMCASW